MAREQRRVPRPKEEKAETKGKEKGKRKERTTSQRNHRTSRRTVDKRTAGEQRSTPTVRAGEKMTGTQQSRVLQLKNFNMPFCEFRPENVGFLPITWNLLSWTIWHAAACNTVMLALRRAGV